MATATTVRRSATSRSARAVTMHIVASVVTTAATAPPTAVTPPPTTDITTVAIITVVAHETDATRHAGQHRNGQPDFNLVSQTFGKIQCRT